MNDDVVGGPSATDGLESSISRQRNKTEHVRTWFLPLRTSTLVTRPKGMPRWTISASVTSLGMLRMWTTRDGLAGLLGSSLTCHHITTQTKKKTTKSWASFIYSWLNHGIQLSHFLVCTGEIIQTRPNHHRLAQMNGPQFFGSASSIGINHELFFVFVFSDKQMEKSKKDSNIREETR